LASDEQFRSTFEGALSYFVGTGHHGEDSGFAIKGWTAVRFENEEVVISGTTAMAMGNYYFTDPQGTEVKVEYSFGYMLAADGKLRITLHHSSMPYSGAITSAMVESAQQAWAAGMVNIRQTYTQGSGYVQVARDFLADLYAYSFSNVLFLTCDQTENYRPTLEGALSYLVGTNGTAPHSPGDLGFAIQTNWTQFIFENEDIIISGDTAVAMGSMIASDIDGSYDNTTLGAYSFAYVLNGSGPVRIKMQTLFTR